MMTKAKNFLLLPFLISLIGYSYSQEIDPSILSNLSQDDIEMVKSQINSATMNEFLSEDEKPIITESTVKVVSDDIDDFNNINGQKYGYDFFNSVPTSITAVGDLPLPNDYKISLRDQFTIILSGSKEAIFDLDVKLDGTILFPELGSISVVNETLEDVKSKLRNLIKQSYIGVQIDISIKELAAKKITIVGAVKTPGMYLVNPFSTISSALGYSGGISEIGTLRKIKLIRVDGEVYNFDLYKLLINGDRSDDITIQAGDVIIVDPADQFISLTGEVRRPAIYEIVKGENLENLIKFGLGFNDVANMTNISFEVLDLQSAQVKSLIIDDLSSDLENVISVNVNKYVSKNYSSIDVQGAIKEPGFYNLSDFKTLEDLIMKLEFIDVYPWLGVLEQFDDDNLIKSSVLFSLRDKNTYKDISLLPNSKIFFANLFERKYVVEELSQNLIDDFSLKLRHKGDSFDMPVIGKFSLQDFIFLLGLDMTDVDAEATYISPLEDLIIQKDFREMNFIAKKYNTVFFRSPVNNLIEVSISGAIDYPGKYTLKANSKLDDLYRIVGKFKSEAYTEGIIFKRESVKTRQIQAIEKSNNDLNEIILNYALTSEEAINLNLLKSLSQSIDEDSLGRISGDYSPFSISSQSIVLFDGDSIFVPKDPYTVSVLGEVQSPVTFEYSKKLSIKEAISLAGGFNDYADKNNVYVIRANGLIEKSTRNIFTKNISLKSGDTIIVPKKITINNPVLQSLLPISNILSDLAFSAAAIESLSSN